LYLNYFSHLKSNECQNKNIIRPIKNGVVDTGITNSGFNANIMNEIFFNLLKEFIMTEYNLIVSKNEFYFLGNNR
jgi:citrate lyase alpha subunit